jgi:hypothetical protein
MRARRASLFVLRAVAIYALLLLPWLGLRSAYETAFRSACGLFEGRVGSTGSVRVLANGEERGVVRFLLEKRGSHTAVRRELRERHLGFLPSALLAALVTASPVRWRRRWRALAGGLALLAAFTAARVALFVVSGFATEEAVRLVDVGPLGERLLFHLEVLFVRSPLVSFTAPFLVWLLVTFRREDLPLLTR